MHFRMSQPAAAPPLHPETATPATEAMAAVGSPFQLSPGRLITAKQRYSEYVDTHTHI